MSVYNKAENNTKKRSDTPTPIELCDYIYSLLKDRCDNNITYILDPCSGDRRLTNNFINASITNYEIKEGTDFLKETNKLNHINCVICNPPFNHGQGRKLATEVFLDKILELCNHNIPILIICPMGFRLNIQKSSKRLKKFKNIYPEISTIISLPVDCFEDTLYHSECICFNTPFLKPHYHY